MIWRGSDSPWLVKLEYTGSSGLCSTGGAARRCLLLAPCRGQRAKRWVFEGMGGEKRPFCVWLCAGSSFSWGFVFCRQTVTSVLKRSVCAVCPAVFLLCLAKGVLLIALPGAESGLISVFQCNLFNQRFWNVLFFCFCVRFPCYCHAACWVKRQGGLLFPETVWSSNLSVCGLVLSINFANG